MDFDSSLEESFPLLASKADTNGGTSRQSSASNTDVSASSEVTLYKKRWYILTVFCLVAFVQGLLWNTWSPLGDALYVGLGWSDDFLAFSLAMSSAGIVVFTFPVMYLIETKDLRKGAILAVVMLVAATTTWEISSLTKQSWLFVIGCVFVGVCSCVAIAGPPILSVVWFPASERTTATAIASMSTHIGIGLGFIAGPSISGVRITGEDLSNVTSIPDEKVESILNGIHRMGMVDAVLACLCFIVVLIHFPAKPPTPASRAQMKGRTDYWSGLKKISCNRDFWILNMAFNFANGTFNAWMPMVSVNFSNTFNLGEGEGDWIGFIATILSCFASIGIALVVDRYKRHTKLVLEIMAVCAMILFAILSCMQQGYIVVPEDYLTPVLYILVIGISVCMNGGVPLYYELSCEITYPVYEGLSAAYITVVNDLCGLLFYALFFIPQLQSGDRWMTWVCLGSCMISFPMLIILKEKFNRLNVEVVGETVDKEQQS